MTAPRLIRIVEDDAVVAASLAALLESWGFVAETYADGESFLDAPPDPGVCCILLDVRLPGLDGLEVLRMLRKRGMATPVIILTGHGEVAMAVQALRDGAQDFIEKPYDDEDLVQRIDRAGEAAGPSAESERFTSLTPRERQVMHEVVAGHSNKVVARRLGLSPRTVEVHRQRVMTKTGADSLSQLVRMALKAGIDPDLDTG